MKSKEFLYQLNNQNSSLVTKMEACTSPEEAYQVAADAGLTDTLEEFTSYMSTLAGIIAPTESDLEGMAVGSTASDVSTIVTGSTSILATSAGAAAACY